MLIKSKATPSKAVKSMIFKNFIKYLSILTFIFGGYLGHAQLGESEFLPPKVAFQFEAYAEGADKIRLDFRIAPAYYLYRHRFSVAIDGTAEATLGNPVIPKGKEKEDEFFGLQQVFYESVSFTVPVSRPPGEVIELPIVVGLQGCADAGLCYPPERRRVTVSLPSTTGNFASAGAIPPGEAPDAGLFVSEQDRLAELIRTGSLALVLATFFGVGLLLAFTPCVLPMVPILSGIIAGQGSSVTTGRAFVLSLSYVLGMAVVNTLAGVAAAAAGQQVQAAFQQPWIIVLFALLFVVFALAMFGFFTIQLPSALQSKLATASSRQRGGTVGGVAVMGGLSALIVSACVAPPLFAALAVIAQTGDVWRGGSALFVMSLGMGVPLLVIGTSAGRWLPRAGAWMEAVKKFFGVLMLGVAAWMLERIVDERFVLLLWAVPVLAGAVFLWTSFAPRALGGYLARALSVALVLYGGLLLVGGYLGGTQLLAPLPQLAKEIPTLPFEKIKGETELDQAIAAAAAAGKPVMLDFYADWCVSCKEMERYTFTDPEVQRVLEGAVLLKADVTANDEQDQALLRRFGIFGPPTIAFWSPNGEERSNFRVVGFMKANEFARVAAQAIASGPGDAPPIAAPIVTAEPSS
jgi:thiol:disulfide interchange protein DsbD